MGKRRRRKRKRENEPYKSNESCQEREEKKSSM
jgi:hypothetical protein